MQHQHLGPSRLRRGFAVVATAVAALGATFVVNPPPVAAAPAGRPTAVLTSSGDRGDTAVRAFWTPQRMASAEAVDAPTPARLGMRRASTVEQRPQGEPVVVPGADGGRTSSEVPVATSTAEPLPNAYAESVPAPYTDLPDRLHGKVFFTSGGLPYVCSGTLINNPTSDMVWTAGHCVHDGAGGSFVRHWAFVPAYGSSGPDTQPYGTWTARKLTVLAGWGEMSDWGYDVGAVLLDAKDGRQLGELIGGHGIAFNLPTDQVFSALGYPHAPPFDGQLLYRCDATLPRADRRYWGSGPVPIGIDCDMTGGSSGGGWLINIGPRGRGVVNSVVSYRYADDALTMYGPYQGSAALSLYDSVNAPAPTAK